MSKKNRYDLRRFNFRSPQFECLEQRTMLSVSPVTLSMGDYTAQSAIYGENLSYASTGVLKYNSIVDDLIGLSKTQEKYGLTGAGQTVVIIDSGITTDHNAFSSGQIVGGWDFAENDANYSDDSSFGGHGTHLAGILAGSTVKYSGVAPGVDLVILRVFDDNGVGSFELIEQALQWVEKNLNSYDNPITAVNLSVGSVSSNSNSSDWTILDDELKSLNESGVFISVAAGNDYKKYPDAGVAYPASSEYTVSVGALDGSGKIADYTQRNSETIFAPGYGIYSSVPDILGNNNNISDDYTRMTGSSMSTPIITGVSCLLREAFSKMGYETVSQSDIYGVMVKTADKVFDSVSGQNYNRINVLSAVEYIFALERNTQTGGESTGGSSGESTSGGTTETTPPGETGGNTGGNTGETGGGGSSAGSNPVTLPEGVTVSGNKIIFTGTEKNDALKVDASGTQWKFTFNGSTFTYSFSAISSIQCNLGLGTDAFEFIASSGTDSIRCYQEYTLINGGGYVVKAFGAEKTAISADSADTVTFYDSVGNDSFNLNLNSKSAVWTSGAVSWSAGGMKEVNVSQYAGGVNTASIYDSSNTDLFSVSESAFAYNGDTFRAYIVGLINVNLYSVNGGMDTVRYTGSTKDILLTAQEGGSTLTMGNTTYKASGFFYTYAYGGTGFNTASLRDSANITKADYVIADLNKTKLYSSNYQIIVSDFQSVTVTSSDTSADGADSASLYGSDSTEKITASSQNTTLSDGKNKVVLVNFANRRLSKLSGSDSVAINDAALEGYLNDNADGKYSASQYTLWFN